MTPYLDVESGQIDQGRLLFAFTDQGDDTPFFLSRMGRRLLNDLGSPSEAVQLAATGFYLRGRRCQVRRSL